MAGPDHLVEVGLLTVVWALWIVCLRAPTVKFLERNKGVRSLSPRCDLFLPPCLSFCLGLDNPVFFLAYSEWHRIPSYVSGDASYLGSLCAGARGRRS